MAHRDTYIDFLALRNYQVNAKSASEIDYPWIARVVHSRQYSRPQLCTAVCIGQQIFITAARCVTVLKITYTSLIYQDQRLKPKAFVLPTNKTKQMYDDVGFIIVHDEFPGQWKALALLDEQRTDRTFTWFENMVFDEFEHKVVGYAKFKTDESSLVWKRPYHLTQLKVHVSLDLCREILIYNQRVDGFAVPCYHSCTLAQFEGKEGNTMHTNCMNYHGSEGSAIINLKTNKLLGIATWGAYFKKHELPVGFSIPNSDNFLEDKICAEKIRDDSDFIVDPGYYQQLCDDNGNRRIFNRNNKNRH
ncbi:uncharacterized protein LOC112051210 isoform X2 [Bicyclus anynana]|uniref:Uncharacterized protein LOC112051210 isoform X2 n=1 Tax=Bicyclus anynana TaxID=110368 RepID=A0A6J1NKS1_BICAN|nr:uncharacterized protein LOC112051210 isoform X2 [Bicyclus anynana]